jgi:hypothetical protein
MSTPQVLQSEAAAAFNFCSYWPGIKVGLTMASGSLSNPALKAAIAGLISAADSYCGGGQLAQLAQATDRASIARAILDKAAADPAWKEKLVQDTPSALAESGVQPAISAYLASLPVAFCGGSCAFLSM